MVVEESNYDKAKKWIITYTIMMLHLYYRCKTVLGSSSRMTWTTWRQGVWWGVWCEPYHVHLPMINQGFSCCLGGHRIWNLETSVTGWKGTMSEAASTRLFEKMKGCRYTCHTSIAPTSSKLYILLVHHCCQLEIMANNGEWWFRKFETHCTKAYKNTLSHGTHADSSVVVAKNYQAMLGNVLWASAKKGDPTK